MNRSKCRKINLYVECRNDFSIVDDAGRSYTPDQARAIRESGNVGNYNLAFGRLMSLGFDVERLRRFYAENP